jgi:uracil-DNA glycosylase family 4
LYPALFRAGFANQPESDHRGDGLVLTDLYTAPVCRCAPPQNKPSPEEMNNCQPYLVRELTLINPKVIVVLGRIAFDRILTIYSIRKSGFVFAHAAHYRLPTGEWLLCSYHPSQQNTLTGRLTISMFDHIWELAHSLITSQ